MTSSLPFKTSILLLLTLLTVFSFPVKAFAADVEYSLAQKSTLESISVSDHKNEFGIYALISGSFKISESISFEESGGYYFEGISEIKLQTIEDEFDHLDAIRQLGIEFGETDFYSLFIGRKILTWARADEINPIDVINTEDLRRFVLFDKKRRKISREMIAAEINLFDATWSFVAMPKAEKIQLPKGKRWCKGDCETFDLDSLLQQFRSQGLSVEKPERESKFGDNWEYAARMSSQFNLFNYGLTYWNGESKYDLFEIGVIPNLGLAEIMYSDKRHSAYGADMSFIVSGFGLRAEALYRADHPFNIDPTSPRNTANRKSVIKKDELNWIVGVDRSMGDFYVNIQKGARQIQAKERKDIFQPSLKKFASFLGEWNLWHGDLTLGYRAFFDLSDSSVFHRPSADYSLSDQFKLGAQVSVFDGKNESLFGAFKENDTLLIRFQWES